MVGGAHRGPVAHSRQRRTLRLMQGLLIVIAAGLLMFAGYALGRSSGFSDGQKAGELGGPSKPSTGEVVVPGLLGLGALAGALLLQGQGGIRIPSPARLEELAGRAEKVALDKAEEAATTNPGPVQAQEKAEVERPKSTST